MGLIKEPKEVDFMIQSEPWTDKELADFRKIMKEQKIRRSKQVQKTLTKKDKKHYA